MAYKTDIRTTISIQASFQAVSSDIGIDHLDDWTIFGISIPFNGVDWDCAEESYYLVAQVTWESFQSDVKTFIEKGTHNGSATVMSPQIVHLANAAIAIFLRSDVPVTSLTCK